MDTDQRVISWMKLEHSGWSLYLAAVKGGLCFAGAQKGSFAELEDFAAKRFKGWTLEENAALMDPYAKQFKEYFDGERQDFTIPVYTEGTPFQEDVWAALQTIPYGEVWSYSDIAAKAGRPLAVRAAGAAIGANPVVIAIPCHRVIGKNGSLTGFRCGLDMKIKLLELEKGNA